MDNTTSEATSSYSSLEMTHAHMYNQSNHTYQRHLEQQMNEGMTHSQANQDQFPQGEATHQPGHSHQPRLRGCRGGMSDEQKKERKRVNDANYRQRKKIKETTMTAENEYLQAQVGQLHTEIRHLREEVGGLGTQNGNLKEESERFSTESRRFGEENLRLSAENRNLKEETGRLTERIRRLQGKRQLPAEVLQRQDSCISQSTSQVDHSGVFIQDHYGVEPNNEDAYGDLYWRDSNLEGLVDGSDGLGINDLQSLLFPGNELIPHGGVAINEPAPAHQECSHSGLSPVDMAKTFLAKLDAEDPSDVDTSDFMGLEQEQRKVGRYSFPVSLIPTVEKINKVHGDVAEASLISPSVSGPIYVLFCATVKEMEHVQLKDVTEDKMLKWRDVIKDALRLHFNVKFAMEHLKKIACAYFGQPELQLLKAINAKISSLETEVNDWKKICANIYKESNMCIDAAEMFTGVPVSTGLFHLPSSSTTTHC